MFGRQPFSVAPFCFLAEQEPQNVYQRLQARDLSGPVVQFSDLSGPVVRVRDRSRPVIGVDDETRGVP